MSFISGTSGNGDELYGIDEAWDEFVSQCSSVVAVRGNAVCVAETTTVVWTK